MELYARAFNWLNLLLILQVHGALSAWSFTVWSFFRLVRLDAAFKGLLTLLITAGIIGGGFGVLLFDRLCNAFVWLALSALIGCGALNPFK